MRIVRFIYEIFKKFPLLIVSSIVLQVIVGLVEAGSLFTVGPLVDFLVNPDFQNVSPVTSHIVKIIKYLGVPVTLNIYLVFFVSFMVLSAGFRILGRYSILRIKYVVCRDIMVGAFKDFFGSRWYFFSSSRQGVLLNTFMREINVVGNAFGAMANLFAAVLRFILCLAVPFVISWQVTTISLFIAAVLTWPFLLLGKISYRLGKLNTSTANQISNVVQESLSMAKDILGFGNQKGSVDSLGKAYDDHVRVTVKSQTITNSIPILYKPFSVLVLVVSLLLARYFNVPLSDMAVLLFALLYVVISIGDLTAGKTSLEMFFPSYEQVGKLRQRAKELKQYSGDKIFNGFDKEIGVKNVCFAYPGHDLVLKNINIVIPKGKMIAIVGESGAGKSTFIDILMGFNEPVSGRVLFDGIDSQEFDINSYRKRIGYVPQDTTLFNMSIRDNLVWAKENATEQEILKAAELANIREFVEVFPEKYNTIVGDRGVRLSGGQKQRIALARAILRKPYLLVLDEATSSLDTQSERLIQQAIENIAKETTIVVIAHRLSTIVNADYIYVFENGKIIEEGRYQELLSLDGQFNRMVRLQLLEAV